MQQPNDERNLHQASDVRSFTVVNERLKTARREIAAGVVQDGAVEENGRRVDAVDEASKKRQAEASRAAPDEPEQGKQAKRGAFAVVRRSFYLALGSPAYTLACLLGVLLLTLLMGVTGVLFISVWAGMIAFITTISTRELLIKYEVIPAPISLPVVPDSEFRIE